MQPDYALGKDLPTDQLPFSGAKQGATIGHCLKDPKFFRFLRDRVASSTFALPFDQIVWAAMLAFGKEFERAPTEQEVWDTPSVKRQDPETKTKLRERVVECVGLAAQYGRDVLETELTAWLQACAYIQMWDESHRQFNREALPEALEVVNKKVREILDTRFVHDGELSPDDYGRVFEKRAAEMEDACTFGSTVVDRLLNPEAKNGSMLPRASTLLVGTVNSGKTRSAITIVRHNAFRGKNCLVFMHEGDGEDVYSLLYTALISRPENGTFVTPAMVRQKFYGSAEGRQIIEQARDVWRDHICFVPMIRPGLTVEEVVTTARRKQDEWAAKHGGQGFHLFADDYPALLTTAAALKGNMARREKDHLVYLTLNQLVASDDFQAHGLFLIQGNRNANKVVRGHAEKTHKRLMVKEDIEEAFGPAETCPTVVTITRDDLMAKRGHVVFYIDKSRTGQAGHAIVCRSMYGSCITHADGLGATWYTGTGSHAERVEQLLQQYPGQAVPDHVMTALAGGE